MSRQVKRNHIKDQSKGQGVSSIMPPKKATKPTQPKKDHSVSEDSDYELPDSLEGGEEEEEEDDPDSEEDEEEPAPPPRKKGRGNSRVERSADDDDDGYQSNSGRKVPKKQAFKKPQPVKQQPPKKQPARKPRVNGPKKPDYYGETVRKSRNEVISEEELPVMNMATKPKWIYCSYDLGFGHTMKFCKVRVTKDDEEQFDFDATQFTTKGAEDKVFKYNMKIETIYATHAALGHYINRLEAQKAKENGKSQEYEYDD